ncbi:MGDG synthase family glycosyltransferase [Propionicimonas sp.]|uniref:MGDG synthase family glycosyltransferase n=1 Tax=Propionicimonas sp. TaxID=1955623 RepID=UPI0039E56FF9
MGRRVMILAAGVGSGHNMAASAVQAGLDGLAPDDEVRRLDILETTNELFNRLYDDAYFQLVAQVPWLVGWGYDNADPPFKLAASPLKWLEQLNTVTFVRELRDYNPDVVICTHFLPARLVSLMIARKQLRATLTVVTTDYDFQGLWLTSPFHHFFAAREETGRYLASIGIPEDRVSAPGIPVRSGLADPVDEAAVRAEFGLRPGVPVVLISAGAAGGSYTTQVVRQALRMSHPFQAVIVCGRNAELKAEIELLVAAAGREDDIVVLGFTDRMADLMRVSSLFVGKPGGLSSSECMAAGLPMVLVNPIPGQEVRNADYLLESGAAVRCNYATTVGYKIDQLLADSSRLQRMAAAARQVGRPDAGHRVATTSLACGPEPLWISRDAQRSMMQSVEDGVAALDAEGDRRLRTLRAPETGESVALVTEAELEVLGVREWSRSVQLVGTRLNALRWQPENFDLASTGRWLLDHRDERTLDVLAPGERLLTP